MKKVLSFLLPVCILLTFAACKSPVQPTEPAVTTEVTTTPTDTEEIADNVVVKQQPMAAVSMPAITESTTAEDGTVLFNYTYQNMSLILQDPDVADKVIIDFLNRVDKTSESANTIRASAENAYSGSDNWIPYLCNISYSPMRIDQGVLSLSGKLVTYSGASHPERSCMAASYDLVTGDVLTLASIMSVTAKAEDFCKLTKEALKEVADAKYLYEGYEKTVDERFSGDLSNDENWYFTQRGLCFYFAPYEIAPYASGIITVEIPYEKLAGLLYDGYFPAERQTTAGEVNIAGFVQEDLQDYTQIAEIVLQRGADKLVLSTDGAVQDVRLIIATDEAGTEVYTALAAQTLTLGDAIVIEASEQQIEKMTLSYLSEDEIVSVPLK